MTKQHCVTLDSTAGERGFGGRVFILRNSVVLYYHCGDYYPYHRPMSHTLTHTHVLSFVKTWVCSVWHNIFLFHCDDLCCFLFIPFASVSGTGSFSVSTWFCDVHFSFVHQRKGCFGHCILADEQHSSSNDPFIHIGWKGPLCAAVVCGPCGPHNPLLKCFWMALEALTGTCTILYPTCSHCGVSHNLLSAHSLTNYTWVIMFWYGGWINCNASSVYHQWDTCSRVTDIHQVHHV